jgi:Mn-dependent DtxR family transcriptional regulator
MKKKKARFGIVDAEVLQDPSLSTTAKAVYSLLSTFANKNRVCFPSITHLSELLDVNRRTVERAIRELSNKNYVSKDGKNFTLK